MTELVTLTLTANEAEAALVCGLLLTAGIDAVQHVTDQGFGSGGEMPSSGSGVRAVLVRNEDVAAAREVLAAPTDTDDFNEATVGDPQ